MEDHIVCWKKVRKRKTEKEVVDMICRRLNKDVYKEEETGDRSGRWGLY